MTDPFNLTQTEVTYFGLGRDDGLEDGIDKERERILTQWQYEMNECKCEDAMGHMERRIKGETK